LDRKHLLRNALNAIAQFWEYSDPVLRAIKNWNVFSAMQEIMGLHLDVRTATAISIPNNC
jgi:hypothetical protein